MDHEIAPRSEGWDADRSRRVYDAADAQWSVLCLDDLRACGLSRTTVARWTRARRLHRIFPEVYAVGTPPQRREGWWMAAVLACGDGALLAARSALALYAVASATTVIDVAVARDRGDRLAGIRPRRLDLAPEERSRFHGIPVTTLSRALLDAAPRSTPERLAMALNEALHLGRYDHAEMLSLLERRRGHRGIRPLRQAVGVLGDEALTLRSSSEARALELLRAADLELPEANAFVLTSVAHGHELDLFWRSRRLNVEIDGPRHELPWQRRKDALRDRDLEAQGIRVVRVPWTVLHDDPERFVARIAALLR